MATSGQTSTRITGRTVPPTVLIDTTDAVERLGTLETLVLGGLTLVERAVLTAHRAGAGAIRVVGAYRPSDALMSRLRARGVRHLSRLGPSNDGLSIGRNREVHPPVAMPGPFCGLREDAPVVVLPIDVVVSTPALARLFRRSAGFATPVEWVDPDDGASGVVVLPPNDVARLRNRRTIAAALAQLGAVGGALRAYVTPGFCRRLRSRSDAVRIERAYIRHLNGEESVFTNMVRFFSVPVTTYLLRLRLSPNQVTLGGFGLAVLSALAFAAGGYAAGLVGAGLYYASMVLDCSDGEVARASFQESLFGAWFEALSDYASYFLILGGITLGSVRLFGVDYHVRSALVAAVFSVVLVPLVLYLRRRLAGQNPGQFGDKAVEVLQRSSVLHRLSGMGQHLLKRSFIAQLLVLQALTGQIPAVLHLWAIGATGGLLVTLFTIPVLVRRLKVTPMFVVEAP